MLDSIRYIFRYLHIQANLVQSIALLAIRLWIAKIFFMSGLTKIYNWETTLALFEDEYMLPLLTPDIAAYTATTAELLLPALLTLGLFTPVAALALLLMTLVIELFVYPGTTEHIYWLLLTGLLLTHGSGRFSIDHWLLKTPQA